jgi:hypothetical protein
MIRMRVGPPGPIWGADWRWDGFRFTAFDVRGEYL